MKNNPEFSAQKSTKLPEQQNKNLLEEDQIYKEFSHQDFNNFLFPEKELKPKIDNTPSFFANNSENDNKTTYFDNFPNIFQNPNMPQQNINDFGPNPSEIPQNYSDFFNVKPNEESCENNKAFDFSNKNGENAFDSNL